jgi:hypothetical protein
LQKSPPLSSVLGPNQRPQQVVQVPLDAFAQHEAVMAGQGAGMTAGPQDQVIRLGEDDPFLVVLLYSHYRSI